MVEVTVRPERGKEFWGRIERRVKRKRENEEGGEGEVQTQWWA